MKRRLCLVDARAHERRSKIGIGDEAPSARVAGCDQYVTKPYSPMQLLRVVRGYLGGSSI